MQILKFTLSIFLLILLSCSSNTKVTGKYYSESGDVLKLKKNERYYLTEKSNSKKRKTTGIWLFFGNGDKDKIRFFCWDDKGDYTMTVTSTLAKTKYSLIQVYLSDTDSILPMYWAIGIRNINDSFALWPLHTSYMNEVGFDNKVDTVVLSLTDFAKVKLPISYTLKRNYIIRLFPKETLYKFDNPTYKIFKNKLIPMDDDSTDRNLRFKKNGA